jgi:hypothetical protein
LRLWEPSVRILASRRNSDIGMEPPMIEKTVSGLQSV